MYPPTRMRRYRRNEYIRRFNQEIELTRKGLIQPVFVVSGKNREEPIPSMPGVFRRSLDLLRKTVSHTSVSGILVFGVPEPSEKDKKGSAATAEDSIVPSAIRALKNDRPDLVLITDVCLCAYTSHGHCGILTKTGEVDNDETVRVLADIAEVYAAAGADMVAPSAMMDGQVTVIRERLDSAGLQNTAILSYAAKFASCFYGPFREAAESSPSFGDRRAYQLSPANRREAIREALQDEKEGADWLMVKPALPYLDVLAELRRATSLPIAAYQVSGEYAMLKQAARDNVFDERAAVLETLLSMKRAGADAVISYYAEEVSQWIDD